MRIKKFAGMLFFLRVALILRVAFFSFRNLKWLNAIGTWSVTVGVVLLNQLKKKRL